MNRMNTGVSALQNAAVFNRAGLTVSSKRCLLCARLVNTATRSARCSVRQEAASHEATTSAKKRRAPAGALLAPLDLNAAVLDSRVVSA
jgi:hypothetical protein